MYKKPTDRQSNAPLTDRTKQVEAPSKMQSDNQVYFIKIGACIEDLLKSQGQSGFLTLRDRFIALSDNKITVQDPKKSEDDEVNQVEQFNKERHDVYR